jgi:hypothetical protein
MRHTLRVCVLACACASCAGCYVVPILWPQYTAESRKNIRDEIMAQIVPGRTTQEEVFLRLGAPDDISADQNTIVYHSAKLKAFLGGGMCLSSYGPCAGEKATDTEESTFWITFENGLVSGKKGERKYVRESVGVGAAAGVRRREEWPAY